MSEFLYLPPFRQWSLFSTVAVGGGSPSPLDDDHEASWLTDGRPGFPFRLNAPDGSATITNPAGAVDFVGIFHHLLDEDIEVDISGGVTDQIVMGPVPRNGVPLNAWTRVTLNAAVTTLTLTIPSVSPGNSSDVLIGEAIAGHALALEPIRLEGSRFLERHYVAPRGSPLAGIPGYSDRARDRSLAGSQYYDQAGLDAILEWYDSQDGYAYPVPSVIVPDSANPYDARLVMLSPPTYTQLRQAGEDDAAIYLVDLEFTELPRTRW